MIGRLRMWESHGFFMNALEVCIGYEIQLKDGVVGFMTAEPVYVRVDCEAG